MLSAIGLAIWYLSKMDSNIDIVKKSIENHESKIENLKDNVTNALFRIDNLEKNDSSKKNSPEVEQPDVASEKQ